MTNAKLGHVAGEHVRYVRGHVGYLKRRDRVTPDLWTETDTGYVTPCWIWNAPPQNEAGYCRVWLRGESVAAHRAMYEQEVGPIPDGLMIDHLCRQPSCVRPDHLEPVTNAVNQRRGNAAKLTDEAVAMIRASRMSHAHLAKVFGVSVGHVRNIRSGYRRP